MALSSPRCRPPQLPPLNQPQPLAYHDQHQHLLRHHHRLRPPLPLRQPHHQLNNNPLLLHHLHRLHSRPLLRPHRRCRQLHLPSRNQPQPHRPQHRQPHQPSQFPSQPPHLHNRLHHQLRHHHQRPPLRLRQRRNRLQHPLRLHQLRRGLTPINYSSAFVRLRLS